MKIIVDSARHNALFDALDAAMAAQSGKGETMEKELTNLQIALIFFGCVWVVVLPCLPLLMM